MPQTTTLNPDPSAPLVDAKRIADIYDKLSTMHVELDADPLEFGPKRLNEKIAICRGILSRCEKVFLEVSQDLHWYKRSHRLATATYALKVQELLTNDPEVRAGRNLTDREAVAAVKLRGDKEHIDYLHNGLEDLEAVLGVVRTKRADLKDIQGRLKDQLKVCQEEISLGARWGSKARGEALTAKRNAVTKSDDQSDDLDSLMDSVIAKQEAETTDAVEITPDPEGDLSFGEPIADTTLKDSLVGKTDFSPDDFLGKISDPIVSSNKVPRIFEAPVEDIDSLFQ